MKKIVQLTTVFAIIAFVSCGKKDTGSTSPTPTPTGDLPVVNLSKANIAADNFEECIISVKDKNGNDVTAQASVTVNGIAYSNSNLKFVTETPGTYAVKATVSGNTSATVNITATAPGTSRHSTKVLMEDYTGAWCGYCPRIAAKFKDLQAINPNNLAVYIHNGDALAYSGEAQMRAKFGVNGFPTAIINRSFKWNETNAEVTNLSQKWAPLGLAINSTVSGTTISGTVSTQFNVTTSIPMTISIMLLESGKVIAQTNYYNTTSGSPYFGLGNPITNYVHDYALRAASTNIFGDAIPQNQIVKDNIYDKTFTFNAASYDITKCDIIAVVSYADGTPGRVGVLNAQIVKAGQNKAFN
jgi:thiol-disulfide isomerase/thioredoxin